MNHQTIYSGFIPPASIQVFILVILGALAGQLERQTLVGELIHPYARRDRQRTGKRLAFSARLGRSGGLSTQLR
jgi:hypothetical protein